MKLCFILACAVLLSTEAKVQHSDINIVLCSVTDGEEMYGLDGEEYWHADFSQGKGVMTLPQFADQFSMEQGAYETAVAGQQVCKANLETCVKSYKSPAEPQNAPQTSIYSKEDVELDSKNTLICHITNFYPSRIRVSWTKNNVNVTDSASLSRHHLNRDGTFNLISTLSFTPEQGDIYTCTVQHTALDRPLTKEYDVQVSLPSVGPSVFCVVGLVAGLLGVAVGTFFLVKGNNCN